MNEQKKTRAAEYLKNYFWYNWVFGPMNLSIKIRLWDYLKINYVSHYFI